MQTTGSPYFFFFFLFTTVLPSRFAYFEFQFGSLFGTLFGSLFGLQCMSQSSQKVCQKVKFKSAQIFMETLYVRFSKQGPQTWMDAQPNQCPRANQKAVRVADKIDYGMRV